MDFKDFLEEIIPRFKDVSNENERACWKAYTEGGEENYKAQEKAALKLKQFQSDPDTFKYLSSLKGTVDEPLLARQLDLLYTDFLENQIPEDLMKRMVSLSTECQKVFNSYRGEVDGKRYSRNDVVEVLKESDDVDLRRHVWEAHKGAGAQVAEKILELVEARNEAARKLGFRDFHDLRLVGQDHDAATLEQLLGKLDSVTREPYKRLKCSLDEKLAARFGTDELRPWHYSDPFMQFAPQATSVDFDVYYKDKDVVEIARRFYKTFDMDPDKILSRSSLHPKEGKSEHAFAFLLDRDEPDARIMCNVSPSDQWMEIVLHELGHALYGVNIDRSLPWRLREHAHSLTTEGVALMMGGLIRNPNWLREVLGLEADEVERIAPAIKQQKTLSRLFFSRWSLVMYDFEKSLYHDPAQDLNTLWWDLVENYQLVKRPEGRDEPDWATKDHIVTSPVYYHNYILGEFFYEQLLERVADEAGCNPSEVTFYNRPDLGKFLKETVFRPGASMHWTDFTKQATGKPLGVEAWVKSLKMKR